MNFQDFQQYIPQILEAPLPAFASHIKMAPKERIESLKAFSYADKNPRKAAVLMLLYPKQEQTHLVLIERNSYEGVHSAQIAFPGGKFENEDVEYETTALRESEEEIGISREQIKVIRPFSPLYIPPSNFLVAPFMGISHEELTFIPDLDEVKRVLEFSIADFLDEKSITKVKMSTSYATDIEVPAFMVDKYVVWGATAMMMSELKETIKCALSKCNL